MFPMFVSAASTIDNRQICTMCRRVVRGWGRPKDVTGLTEQYENLGLLQNGGVSKGMHVDTEAVMIVQKGCNVSKTEFRGVVNVLRPHLRRAIFRIVGNSHIQCGLTE